MTETQNYNDIPAAESKKAYSRIPRCYRLDTGEEITRHVWYLNKDRTPPRAVIETGHGMERVEVRIEYHAKPDKKKVREPFVWKRKESYQKQLRESGFAPETRKPAFQDTTSREGRPSSTRALTVGHPAGSVEGA